MFCRVSTALAHYLLTDAETEPTVPHFSQNQPECACYLSLHKVKLHSDLVTGEVVLGLHPVLPIEGVHLILGNKLERDRVWPNVPSSPMVLTEGEVIQEVIKGDPVATRAMTKNAELVLTDETKRVSKAVSLSIADLSDLSFLFPTDELSKEQYSDSSLAELFTLALSDSDVRVRILLVILLFKWLFPQSFVLLFWKLLMKNLVTLVLTKPMIGFGVIFLGHD